VWLAGTDYRDGSALWYALSNPLYSRFLPIAEPAFVAMKPLLSVLTRMTLWWEIAFAFMLPFRKLRLVALAFGLFVHGGIFVLMTIEWWGPLMMLSYFAFVPGRALDRLWARQLRSVRARLWDERLQLEYDPTDTAAVRWVAAIATTDAFRLVHVVAAPDRAARLRLTRRGDGVEVPIAALRPVLPIWAAITTRTPPRSVERNPVA
jgi:hypothetical protein